MVRLRGRQRLGGVVTHDGIASLSLGLSLVYALGLFTYRLGERGWPHWVPKWLPGPVWILYVLPFYALLMWLAAILMVRLRARQSERAWSELPWICWVAGGACVVGFVMTAVRAPYWFRFYWLRSAASIDHRAIVLWCLLIAPCLPVVYLWLRLRRIPAPGRCRRCGYDLTGNVSGTCPECGTGIPDNSR